MVSCFPPAVPWSSFFLDLGTAAIQPPESSPSTQLTVTFVLTPTEERSVTSPPGAMRFHDKVRAYAAGEKGDDELFEEKLKEFEGTLAE